MLETFWHKGWFSQIQDGETLCRFFGRILFRDLWKESHYKPENKFHFWNFDFTFVAE
jgi:hypothetical protein